jgi:chromosome segregation ATPase
MRDELEQARDEMQASGNETVKLQAKLAEVEEQTSDGVNQDQEAMQDRLKAAEVAMTKSASEAVKFHSKLAKSMAALDRAQEEAAETNRTSNSIRKEVDTLRKELESFKKKGTKTDKEEQKLRKRVAQLTGIAKKWHTRALALERKVHAALLEATVEAGKPWDIDE